MLVGTTSGRETGSGFTAQSQVEGLQTVSSASFTITSNRDTDDLGGRLNFARSKGGAIGSNTIVDADAEFGGLYFFGADGTDTNSIGAQINAYVDGTPGSNDMPGRLTFSTTADGAASPTERLRIDSLGNIGVNQTSVNSSRKMEITQPSSYTSGLRINSAGSAGNGAYVEFFVGSANYKVGGDHNTNALLFQKDGTEYMRHDSSLSLIHI